MLHNVKSIAHVQTAGHWREDAQGFPSVDSIHAINCLQSIPCGIVEMY